ncbi:MAG: amidohydrolase family protein [Phycisphaerales bacterium]|nr:MAG: amidohydrolase family protein [Phycisphaerales bacterium]
MGGGQNIVLRARWVVPVEGPPIENGAVAIHDGGVVAVATARDLAATALEDLGDVVLLPGFVNAHTHLELSRLVGVLPTDSGFVPWLERLTAMLRAGADPDRDIEASVRAGLRESAASGVTVLADVTRRPEVVRRLLADGPLRALSFGEVIAVGRIRGELTSRLDAAAGVGAPGHVGGSRPADSSCLLRIGISPHSPYTVEPDGLRACAARAGETALPLCVHLAETAEEEMFTVGGTAIEGAAPERGPLQKYLKRLDVWDDAVPCPRRRPVELAAECGLLRNDTVLAHANFVSDADIQIIAESGAHVAYCPRTHRAFGHPPHRFREMLGARINVCVGTDSLASNPSLSVLDELRFLRREFPHVPPQTLLRMGTLNGARALGWDERIGSLRPGKDADIVAVPYDTSGPTDPLVNVLTSTLAPAAAYVRGIRRAP